MADRNGVSIMPIFELNQEEEEALKKKRARLDRTEAVLAWLGSLLWIACYAVCAGFFGFIGFFIGLLVYESKVILVLFIIGYVVGVMSPAMTLTEDLLERIDLRFTEWWVAFYNRRVDDVKWEYKLKKAEAMNIEIDKAFD